MRNNKNTNTIVITIPPLIEWIICTGHSKYIKKSVAFKIKVEKAKAFVLVKLKIFIRSPLRNLN